jgi:hypothetical protein
MTDPLEAELDRLFRLPPVEMVEARNALADQLRRAGDKAGAARVKAIKRAVPVAWALNQVHFTQPLLLERARKVTRDLRELHSRAGIEARRISAAVEQQRVAMQAVVDAALRAGRAAGMSETALQPRKVFTTVQAWLAGKGEDAPGRMTQELEASGFEAFAGMTVNAPLPTPATPVASAAIASEAASYAPTISETPDHAELEQAKGVAAEREQLTATALELMTRRVGEQASAQQARDQAQTSVREAERQLAELRAMLEQRTRELKRRSAMLDEARALHAQAQAAAEAARSELDERINKS